MLLPPNAADNFFLKARRAFGRGAAHDNNKPEGPAELNSPGQHATLRYRAAKAFAGRAGAKGILREWW
jgi:hypothetical protein